MIFDSSTAIDWGLNLGQMFKTMFDAIAEIFQRAFLAIASLVYNVVNIVYQVFLTLAQANIFTESDYKILATRIYVVLGVVMLFVLAYNFLLLVIDPDKNKGGQTVEKMLKNIVTTFIMIVLTPSIFAYAYEIQTAILQENQIIERFFANAVSSSGETVDATNLELEEGATVRDGGKNMAVSTFTGFFFAIDNTDSKNSVDDEKIWNMSYEDNWIYQDKDSGLSIDCSKYHSCNYAQVKEYVTKTGEFAPLYAFANNIRYGFELAAGNETAPSEPVKTGSIKMSYNWLLAVLAGGYLVYVIISFCFDLGIRVVKLAFYQMIAPLTISCRVIPNKEGVFTTWMKQTIETFISVFIRVFIMQLGVYLINIFTKNVKTMDVFQDVNIFVRAFSTAFIVLGIVTFIKTAPSLICKIFGIEEVGALGLKEKFAAGGGFALGAGVGAMVTGGVRNAVSGIRNNKWKGQGFKTWAKNAASVAGSTIAGAGSGAARGLYQGRNAKSWSQMSQAAGNAATAVTQARDDRIDRKEAGTNVFAAGFANMKSNIGDWATAGDRTQEKALKEAAERKKAFDEMEAQAQKVLDKLNTNRDFYSALFEVHSAMGLEKEIFSKVPDSDRPAAVQYYEEHKNWAMQDYEARLDALKNGTAAVDVDRNQFLTYDQQAIRTAAEAQVDKTKFLTTDTVAYQAAQEAAASKITLEQCGGDIQKYAEARDAAKASVKIESFQQLDTVAYEKQVSDIISGMDLSSFVSGIDETSYTNAVQNAMSDEIRTLTNVMTHLQKAAIDSVSAFANGDLKRADENGNVLTVTSGETAHDVMETAIGKLDITDVQRAAQNVIITTSQTITQPVYAQEQKVVIDTKGNQQIVFEDVEDKKYEVKLDSTIKMAKDADKHKNLRDKRAAMENAADKAKRDARRAKKSSDKK